MSARGSQILLATLLLLGPALAGCLGGSDAPVDPASIQADQACEHPHPCQDPEAWPDGLTGPFEVLAPQRVTMESFDGTTLSGVLWMPDVPDGVQVPVVIESTPYAEQINPPADQQSFLDGRDRAGYILNDLLENGYAVVIFSVRGTGSSDGCFDFWGTTEQRDQAEIVRWAAQQPWSNGRVGMYGLSYMGTTPWEAAVQAPEALKTIVVSGIITHPYFAGFTPQGAASTIGGPYAIGLGGAVGMGPRATAAIEDPMSLVDRTGVEPCPQSWWAVSGLERSNLLDERDATWIEDRDLIGQVDQVSAAVLYTAGYQDGTAHQFQDDAVWHALTDAPKRMVTGHWGHVFPTDHVEPWGAEGVEAYQLAWFDHWLKGEGDASDLGIGTATYETADGSWRNTTSWPPAEATHEALFLDGTSLSPEPAPGEVTFANAPVPLSPATGPCTEATGQTVDADTARFTFEATEAFEFAGNPMAYLTLSTDGPGGVVSVELYKLPAGEGDCLDDPLGGDGQGLAFGAADLRFHEGNLQARDFPTGTPTPVRVDLWSTGARLEAGERLVLIASWEPILADGKPLAGTITIHGGDDVQASHLVLPVVDGTTGGQATGLSYPERPFAPGYPVSFE